VADACDVTREEKAPFDSLHIGDGATLLLLSTSRGPLYHVLRLVFRVKDVLEGCPTTGLRSGMRCVRSTTMFNPLSKSRKLWVVPELRGGL
jgi:hypothetical protein